MHHALVGCWLSLCTLPWAAPDAVPQASFNVKDFGAKGDGQTDDTQAIQTALRTAAKKVWSEQYPGSAYFYSAPVLFFPTGKYVIRDTLEVGVNLAGEGGAILFQTSPDKDILAGGWVWRWSVSGLTFVGGRDHLRIGNPNIDTGRILIDQCAFYKSAGVAVHLQKGSNSTQVSIRDSVFIHCNQALVNHCDMATISDCWISSSPQMQNQAVLENRGTLLVENLVGVPAVVPGNDQRWIDNYGGVTCRGVRFGGEDAGFTPVVNFAKYVHTYPVIPTYVILDSCFIYGFGNPKRRAAIYCEEVPNQIVVRSSSGLPDLPVVRVSERLDLETYLQPAEGRRSCLRFYIARDNVEVLDFNAELPEPMRRYQVAAP